MVPLFTAEDADVLFEWLLYPSDIASVPSSSNATTLTSTPPSNVPSALTVKAKVLESFVEEFRQKPHLEAHLRVGSGMFSALKITLQFIICSFTGGFLVILTLLDIPLETIRILALKLVGLLLNNNPKNAALFRRVNGFERILVCYHSICHFLNLIYIEICNMLSHFPPTAATCATLLSLAVDAFGYVLWFQFSWSVFNCF